MNEEITGIPARYQVILEQTRARGFAMPSDLKTGVLLKTLAASKPGGRFLEIGTGTGLSTAWILAGMDAGATLVSLDNAAQFQQVAGQFLGGDSRLQLELADGGQWIRENLHLKFDLIFADSWPGKYQQFRETIHMLNKGGIYIVDDMCPQPNWPEGHSDKVAALLKDMDGLEDVALTKMVWSTGIIVLVKK